MLKKKKIDEVLILVLKKRIVCIHRRIFIYSLISCVCRCILRRLNWREIFLCNFLAIAFEILNELIFLPEKLKHLL